MTNTLELTTAIGAGALSFLSPCVLPLVPAYLCYMAGVSVDDFKASAVTTGKGVSARLFVAALMFVLGFSTVFIALGAGASTIGQLLRAWQTEIAMVAGVAIILMGLNFLGVLRIGLFSREARFSASGGSSPVMAYVMGLAFAFGWTPCIGPVLGPILTLAGARDTMSEGAVLLAAYSLGLGIPFLLAALFSNWFMGFSARFRQHLGRVEKVIGVLLVIVGILFLTGGMQTIAFWLLEAFPALGQLG